MTKPHFSKGRLPLAFVFSAPGTRELAENKPVAGVTGENLNYALSLPHTRAPNFFAAADRYEYRITNAFPTPLSVKLKSGRTEASKGEIVEPQNVARVIRELAGVNHVVLCGVRPQYLEGAITSAGFQIVRAWHTAGRGLAKYNDVAREGATPRERTELRLRAWVSDVLRQFR